jgi:hypothetical protein
VLSDLPEELLGRASHEQVPSGFVVLISGWRQIQPEAVARFAHHLGKTPTGFII